MSKFNLNSISGGKKIGEGLLNESSKENKRGMEVVYLKLSDISANKKNKYSKDDEQIVSLMSSIASYGLDQPLVVVLKDEGYCLTTGHRRFEALQRLHELNQWEDSAPCYIKDLNRVNLPLSEDMKERYSIIVTNRESRKYSDADILMEVEELDQIYSELRKNGYKELENPDGIHIQIKGIKNRDLIAKELKMSSTQVGRVQQVIKKADESVRAAIEEGKMTIHTATQLIDMPKEEQAGVIDRNSDKNQIIPEDIQNVKKETTTHIYSIEDLRRDINEIGSQIGNKEVSLSENEKRKYDKAIETIKKLFK